MCIKLRPIYFVAIDYVGSLLDVVYGASLQYKGFRALHTLIPNHTSCRKAGILAGMSTSEMVQMGSLGQVRVGIGSKKARDRCPGRVRSPTCVAPLQPTT